MQSRFSGHSEGVKCPSRNSPHSRNRAAERPQARPASAGESGSSWKLNKTYMTPPGGPADQRWLPSAAKPALSLERQHGNSQPALCSSQEVQARPGLAPLFTRTSWEDASNFPLRAQPSPEVTKEQAPGLSPLKRPSHAAGRGPDARMRPHPRLGPSLAQAQAGRPSAADVLHGTAVAVWRVGSGSQIPRRLFRRLSKRGLATAVYTSLL